MFQQLLICPDVLVLHFVIQAVNVVTGHNDKHQSREQSVTTAQFLKRMVEVLPQIIEYSHRR
jgi:hypothetical protein